MNEWEFKDLVLGVSAEFEVHINKEMPQMFCQLTGDENPLHTDSKFAQDNGFKDKVVYGMLTSSFYSRLIGMYLPGKHCLLHEMKATYLKPVYEGDILTVRGEIVHLNDTFKQIEIKASIHRGSDIVSRAKIKKGVLH